MQKIDTQKQEEIIELVKEAWLDEGTMYTAEEAAKVLEVSPALVESVIADYNETADIEIKLSQAEYSYFEDPDETAIFTGEGIEIEEEEEDEDGGSLTSMIVKQLAVSAVVFAACCLVSYLIFA